MFVEVEAYEIGFDQNGKQLRCEFLMLAVNTDHIRHIVRYANEARLAEGRDLERVDRLVVGDRAFYVTETTADYLMRHHDRTLDGDTPERRLISMDEETIEAFLHALNKND